MKQVRELYEDAYKTHGYSLASLLIPKGRQYERFAVLTARFGPAPFSVLDFGCGFGDLLPFLSEHFDGVSYTGVDIVPAFLEECRTRHAGKGEFRLIEDYRDIVEEYDYVLISGTFNTLCAPDKPGHWSVVQETLMHLFSKTRQILSVDFMTSQVDFEQDGAYHQDPEVLYRFARERMSRRLLLDQSYLPFEFCLSVWKNSKITRPQNIYGHATV